MTWNEPLLARQERIKSAMNFHPKVLLARFFCCLLSSFPLLILPFFYGPIRLSARQDQLSSKQYYFMIFSIIFLAWCITVLLKLVDNRIEITYRLNERGIRIRRARAVFKLTWRQVADLKIINHPTLANLFVIRIKKRTRKFRYPQFIKDSVTFREVFQPVEEALFENISFEAGQIDTEIVLDYYERYGQKSRD